MIVWHTVNQLIVYIRRFDRLNALAQKILAKDPNNKEVLDKLRQLKAEQDLIDELWRKKNKELQDAKNLQVTDYDWQYIYITPLQDF